MKQKTETSTKPSEPEKVDAYLKKLKHPLKEVVEALRKIILSTDKGGLQPVSEKLHSLGIPQWCQSRR